MQLLFKFQAEINDKTFILEQLDSEYDALQILEATQVETIEYLTQLRWDAWLYYTWTFK